MPVTPLEPLKIAPKPAEMPQQTSKTCRKCGQQQPLERFPFRKAEQLYRGTCKACRAAESRALRSAPEHAERIRAAERLRSQARRTAICAWEQAHPDNMRPGRQRRAARAKARRAAARAVLKPTP